MKIEVIFEYFLYQKAFIFKLLSPLAVGQAIFFYKVIFFYLHNYLNDIKKI